MQLIIRKACRTLTLTRNGEAVFTCAAALGREPEGPKTREGDGRTPEGAYRVCLIKEAGKYGRSLGLSYPNPEDAKTAFSEGRIDERTYLNILAAHEENRRPPWGSPLGGEIYIHEGGSHSDWTQGCIALDEKDMDVVFPYRNEIDSVIILP